MQGEISCTVSYEQSYNLVDANLAGVHYLKVVKRM